MKESLIYYDPDEVLGNLISAIEMKYNKLVESGITNNIDQSLLKLNELFNSLVLYYDKLEELKAEFDADGLELARFIARQQALKEVSSDSTPNEILSQEMRIAVAINSEFDHPIFTERLEQAIHDPRTVVISLTESTFKIAINLDRTAGKLSDWVSAIKRARKIKKLPKTQEPLRSRIWGEKLYGAAREGRIIQKTLKGRKSKDGTRKGAGKKDFTQSYITKYWDTINLRLNLSASLAPFWHIINFGVSEYNDQSQGSAYPVSVETNFVGKAKAQIQRYINKLYNSFLKEQMRLYNSISRKYTSRMKDARDLFELIEKKITFLVSRQRTEQVMTNYGYELQMVKQFLGEERFASADKGKLITLARNLQENREMGTRVGLGGGVRMRTVRLIKKYRGY